MIRAKGFLKGEDGICYQFDYVPNEFKIREIRWADKNIISIIGSELDRKRLFELFN